LRPGQIVGELPQLGADRSILESRKLRIKRYIEEQLHDPLLRPATVAQHFGISTRYLRLMFESDREPLSAYLLRRRLERCARFRKRFGVTPRDYRGGVRISALRQRV
jgi:AraC-like DNA-binding protein